MEQILEKLMGWNTPKENQINVAHPYLWNGQWVFDDESRGLDKEPFVAGADDMLDHVTNNGTSCTLLFSKDEFPDYTFKITKANRTALVGTFYDYDDGKRSIDLWLCPALFKYINPAPQEIYFKVKNIIS